MTKMTIMSQVVTVIAKENHNCLAQLVIIFKGFDEFSKSVVSVAYRTSI
jgi:hypothetical protein